MFCGECGTENPDTNRFCKNCGKTLKKPQQAAAPVAQVPVLPAAAPALQTPQASGTMPVQPAVESSVKPARNWFAIISFIVSLVSWLVYPIIIGFIAIVLGVFSLYRAKKNQSKIPVSAVIAIIIGLLAIVLNFFWLDIFPPPAVLPPIK
jgi:Flp pilus assembly protein TadB